MLQRSREARVPHGQRRGRRAAQWPALFLLVLCTACGASSSGTDDPAVLSQEDAEKALSVLQESATSARGTATGRYTLVQSVRPSPEEQLQVVLERRGQYDAARGLHHVVIESSVGEGGELTFLTSASDVLMINEGFSDTHGKRWTRLPQEGLAEVGAAPGDVVFEPPALAVVENAVNVRAAKDRAGLTQYDVRVSQYDAIELFSSQGYVKVAELTGLPIDELATAFEGTMPAVVTLDDEGRLRRLAADLGPILERMEELSEKPRPSPAAGVQVDIQFQTGASVDIDVPDESDIGAVS